MSATEFLGLTPDEFQAEAFGALDEGQSVVVSAPTGAGKTLIAEYAILRALRNGQRAIYTTPIKALSNQKFRELATIAPIEQTGLVTGDNSIRPGAAVVVMTTEVLRNMIYEQPSALDEVAVIVIDEVHFLQDRFRGPVWEEVIVHAPERIQLVCLSATVSNADELGEWIRTLRGPTTTVVRTKRPVRLERWFAVTPKAEAVEIIPLFARKKGDGREPNPQGRRFDPEPTSRRNNRSNSPARKRSKFFTPSRRELIERLDADDMLPAIWFIFSRRGCDEAVGSLRRSGIQMSRASDRPTISAIIDDHTSHLTPEDLDALGFRSWRGALIDGFASHHAGQIPAFKEATEEAFSRGLLKVVFATETLALGINMPARTVVIDKLTKFEGTVAGPDSRAVHEFLSPAQFTQMTGRAGRRGIDDLGHAVVLWSPWVSFEQAATLAANDNFPLKSAFRPTYNMTANLMKRYPEAQAVSVLRRSFAQFQMDRNLVADAERLRRLSRRSEELTAAAHCERGDVAAALRARSRRSSRGRSEPRGAHGPDPEILAALRRLRPGAVLRGGPVSEPFVVISTSERTHDHVTLKVITSSGQISKLEARQFGSPPNILGLVRLPEPYRPNENAWRKKVMAAFGVMMRDLKSSDHSGSAKGRRSDRSAPEDLDAIPVDSEDPVAACPDFRRHVAALNRLARVERDISDVERRIISAESSLEAAFSSVRALLDQRGYVDGWSLRDSGRRLARIHHEMDILVSWAMESGWFVGLTPAELAAAASMCCYQGRRADWWDESQLPTSTVRQRHESLVNAHRHLNEQERSLRLPLTRPPDAVFATVVFQWANGSELGALVDEDMTGGDFVRTSKLIIDLLRQISDLAPQPEVRSAAARAEHAITRGVVRASLEMPAQKGARSAG